MNADIDTPQHAGAAQLREQLRDGRLTAEQAVCAAFERCEANDALNAFITLRRDEALTEARAVDRARAAGEPVAALAGLPIVVKDNIAVGGSLFTGGSPAFRAHVADRDADVVRRLRTAGAIVIGKTNLHEIAFGITSNNAHYGAVRNPVDPTKVAGGSSGGTAAAIAAGVVSIGLGTDTGGSGRIPAAFCGCIGYRPTTGRYSPDGVMLLTTTRDTISLMARSVGDIILTDGVITGEEPPLPSTLQPLRLGVLTPFANSGLTPAVERAFDRAMSQLQRAGVERVVVDGSELLRLDAEAGLMLVMAETYPLWRDYVARVLGIDFPTFVERLGSPDVRAIFQSLVPESGRVPDEAYERVRQVTLPALRAAWDDLFKASGAHAFVYPTVVTTAPPVGEDESVLIGEQRLPLFPSVIRNVAPGSLAGLPGMTLPIPRSGDELPVGLALDAPAGADRALFAIATQVERELSR